MRHPLSTNPTGIAQSCPTRRVRVRLPLATIEELDHLASLYHLTRQDILRRILSVALTSDMPLQPTGPAPAQRLYIHAQLTHSRSVELAAPRAIA